mmetsp:Transcript_55191/g.118621  ORF Transcript_55191/g.118621 Transcript_55191/m.118621 type:complete len:248 (+) Transcript_55191:181-924(+)
MRDGFAWVVPCHALPSNMLHSSATCLPLWRPGPPAILLFMYQFGSFISSAAIFVKFSVDRICAKSSCEGPSPVALPPGPAPPWNMGWLRAASVNSWSSRTLSGSFSLNRSEPWSTGSLCAFGLLSPERSILTPPPPSEGSRPRVHFGGGKAERRLRPEAARARSAAAFKGASSPAPPAPGASSARGLETGNREKSMTLLFTPFPALLALALEPVAEATASPFGAEAAGAGAGGEASASSSLLPSSLP